MSFTGRSSVLLAYVANNDSNHVLTTTTRDGINWSASAKVAGQSSKTSLSLGDNPGYGRVIAYVANNETNALLWTAQEGATWSGSRRVPDQSTGHPPAVAGFGTQLVVAYLSNNPSRHILTAALSTSLVGSQTVHRWTGSRRVGSQSSKSAPALVVFGGRLVMAYVSNNDANQLLVTTSADGIIWTASQMVQGQSSKTSPALAVFNGRLVMAYVSNNDSNQLLVTTSFDGHTWAASQQVQGQSSKAAPSLVAVAEGGTSTRNRLLLAYVSNNPGSHLLVTSSTDTRNWAGSSGVGGQSAKGAPTMSFQYAGAIN